MYSFFMTFSCYRWNKRIYLVESDLSTETETCTWWNMFFSVVGPVFPENRRYWLILLLSFLFFLSNLVCEPPNVNGVDILSNIVSSVSRTHDCKTTRSWLFQICLLSSNLFHPDSFTMSINQSFSHGDTDSKNIISPEARASIVCTIFFEFLKYSLSI